VAAQVGRDDELEDGLITFSLSAPGLLSLDAEI
jgi:hypothetical protein